MGRMGGKILKTPEREHSCDPGWREGGPAVLGGRYAYPPDPRSFPKGTVWQCECGQTWVSQGALARNSPGIIHFRRERRLERRRRMRAAGTS